MEESHHGEFEWPDNLFVMTTDERDRYNNRVREYVLEALMPIPEARALYLSPRMQRVVFQANDLSIRGANVVNKKRYNAALPFHDETATDVILRSLRSTLTHVQSVNFAVGFIHSTLVADEFVFKYPSGNTFLLPHYIRLTHRDHVELLRPYLEPEVVRQRIQELYVEEYGYQVIGIVSIQIVAWQGKLVIGQSDMHSASNFSRLKDVIWDFPHFGNDNKCMYRALAAHLFPRDTVRLEMVTNCLLDLARQHNLTKSSDSNRFDMLKTSVLEDLLGVSIRWYDLDGCMLQCIAYASSTYKRTVRLVVCNDHCAYIHNFNGFLLAVTKAQQLKCNELKLVLPKAIQTLLPAAPSKALTTKSQHQEQLYEVGAVVDCVPFPGGGGYLKTFPPGNKDMCVWHAISALWYGHALNDTDVLSAAKKIHADVPAWLLPPAPNQYRFCLQHTAELEDYFAINIMWYRADGIEIASRHSHKFWLHLARIVVHNEQCFLISDYDKFQRDAEELRRDKSIILPTNDQYLEMLVGCGTFWRDKLVTKGGNCWTFPQTQDNKCFARCLAAVMLNDSQCTKSLTGRTNAILRIAKLHNLTLPAPRDNELDYNKVQLIEELFRMNIRIHDAPRSMAFNHLRYSTERYADSVDLLFKNDHYAVIKNTSAFHLQHICHGCRRSYSCRQSLVQHRCTQHVAEEKRWRFLEGIDKPAPDMFTTLQHILGISTDRTKLRQPFVFFDIECSLSTPTTSNYTANELLRVEQEHVPISIAFAYSENRWHVQNPPCYVSEGNPQDLVDKFYKHLQRIYLELHVKYQQSDYKHILEALQKYTINLERNIVPEKRRATLLIRKFGDASTEEEDCGYCADEEELANNATRDPRVFDGTVEDFLDVPMLSATEEIRLNRSLRVAYRLFKFFDMKAYRLDIVGFNSSKYDLNVLRKYMIPLMRSDGKITAIKRNSRYLSLSNTIMRSTDIWLFLAPTTSFDSFTKAYLRKDDHEWLQFDTKLAFPYEWMTGIDVLCQTEVPPAEYFTSMSRRTYTECNNTSGIKRQVYEKAVEKRELCVEQFRHLGCRTMRDSLIAYNKADVSPGIVAIKNMLHTYMAITKQDLFEFITLASMAKRIALDFTPPDGYFTRFKKKHEQYYHDVRAAIVGGASIVWTRMAEAGKTKIRPYEFGTEALTVQRVIGLDMSGCYLFATSQEHMTGPYFIRNDVNNFKIENDLRNIHSILAIEYYAFSRYQQAGVDKIVQFKGGEKQLLMKDGHIYSVDGYIEIDNQKVVFEYDGCYYHNHIDGCTLPRKHTNKKYDKERAEFRRTQIMQYVNEIVTIHECEWHRLMRLPKVVAFCSKHKLYRTWLRRKQLVQTDIVPMIMRDELKGLFELDAYVPKARRQDFHDVQPFFYQHGITWDMIGETMQQQLEQAKRKFKKPHRLMVNAPFCQKLFLTHYYIKWLVEHGVIIYHVHRIVEFPLCSAPFRELGELICRERQKAASATASEQDKASADSWKLIGNSIYGQFCMAPDKFTSTDYLNSDELDTVLLKRKITGIDFLADNMYEVTHLKPNVTVKQCPQMAVGVYMHAKLRMLSSEYDLSRILDRKKYCLMLTDTDSYYFALAAPTWEECVRSDVTPDAVQAFKEKYFCLSPEKSKYMGLFHVEFDGHTLIALQPKMYFACGDDTQKTATRGNGKRESCLDISAFRRMLALPSDHNDENNEPQEAQQEQQDNVIAQRAMRTVKTNVVTMRTTTSAFNAFYYKRKVLPNNIDTTDLDWKWPEKFDQ